MREVVVTGYGIVSSLGNDVKAVTDSLKNSTSGILSTYRNAENIIHSVAMGNLNKS